MAGNRGTQLIGAGARSGSAGPEAVPDVAVPGVEVRELIDAVRSLRPGAGGTELINQLRALEDLKSAAAAAAAQARIAVAFDAVQRSAEAAAGVPADERGRGIAAQVALARRDPRPADPGSTDSPKPSWAKCCTPSPPSSQAG